MNLWTYIYNFFSMGGYECYVWTAYGIVFVTLFLILIVCSRKLRRLIKILRNHHASQT